MLNAGKLLLLLIFFCNIIAAQSSLYIPNEIKNAIDSGTRTLNGLPGENYWQNNADYIIDAEIEPDSSILTGHVNINYYNNSPDTLYNIVLRLYQNILKKGSLRDWYVDPALLNEGMKLSGLKINGNELNVEIISRDVIFTSTNMILRLKDDLVPGGMANIELDYKFKIPDVVKIRMGNYDDNDMFIAYWYPQVAVYDDVDGWDKIEYAGSVEFYNDFNNYEFNITLPDNFVVWATGELMNPKDVFNELIIDRISTALENDDVVNIIETEDYVNDRVTIKNGKNTWHFKAVNVPDVSFCISDDFIWDAASVEVEPGRKVLANAVYLDGTDHYNNAAYYSRETIKYLSEELPGYPYPYPHVTTFCNKNRDGGMESPMMANNGAPQLKGRHIGLIFHEISHNYFPFIMGTNERKYAWMDEGWASMLPHELVERLTEGYDYYSLRVKSYESNAGKEGELPPMVLSYTNKSKPRTAAYDRPAVAYNELYKYLGKDKFKTALLDYINSWAGKHPLPTDFFYSFNKSANEDLSWFWKPWFYEFGYADLAIDSVVLDKDNISIDVVQKGDLPTQLLITIQFADGSSQDVVKNADTWKNGKKVNVIQRVDKLPVKIVVGNSQIPDINRGDNIYIIHHDES